MIGMLIGALTFSFGLYLKRRGAGLAGVLPGVAGAIIFLTSLALTG